MKHINELKFDELIVMMVEPLTALGYSEQATAVAECAKTLNDEQRKLVLSAFAFGKIDNEYQFGGEPK